MISIIICSRNNDINEELKVNIERTIGAEYELIVIDNSQNRYSIFEAYNCGIEKSSGQFLCFIHDDILFHTPNWGQKMRSYFVNYNEFALMGVAGATVKAETPCGWWDCEEKYKRINIIQHFQNNVNRIRRKGIKESEIDEVVVIDGVFMMLKKEVNFWFNENFEGFHNYDLNISFEVLSKGYKIGVANKILIEHFSMGNLNYEWLKSTIRLHKIYKGILPLNLTSNSSKLVEEWALYKFINNCVKNKRKVMAFKYWLKLFFVNPISKTHLILVKRILKKNRN